MSTWSLHISNADLHPGFTIASNHREIGPIYSRGFACQHIFTTETGEKNSIEVADAGVWISDNYILGLRSLTMVRTRLLLRKWQFISVRFSAATFCNASVHHFKSGKAWSYYYIVQESEILVLGINRWPLSNVNHPTRALETTWNCLTFRVHCGRSMDG